MTSSNVPDDRDDPQDDLPDQEAPTDQLESTVDSIADALDADNDPPKVSQGGEYKDTANSGFDPNSLTGSDSPTKMLQPFGMDISKPASDESVLFGTTEIFDQDVDLQASDSDLADTADTVDLSTDDGDFSIDGESIVDGESPVHVESSIGGDDPDATYVFDKDFSSDASDQGETVQLNQGDTAGSSFGFSDLALADLGASDSAQKAMDKTDIGQTINPRELSQEDQDFWGSLLISGAGNPKTEQDITDLKPAIDRSITETNLRIRSSNVATPKHPRQADSDYRLIRLLGKGGMGTVFVAKQTSLDRLIAVKVIRPMAKKKRDKLKKAGRLELVEEDRRHQFLSEAVVTGDLDHPNIVPIHDIAVTGDNTLFYAMKRVVGTPWSKVIKDKTRDENIDILMKVCDAIGFAHTRGVVHRDIKPENIMLGDFGVVMVMDWGLALAKPEFEKIDSIAHTAGLGGTPAFMAPEMATGPIEKIGPASDVYLLGASLFLIITGTAPHQAESVSMCVKAVAKNTIRDFHEGYRGELMNIALKAMATEPEDRYADVKNFQLAIRQYRSHSESVALAEIAAQDYQRGIEDQEYTYFSRATYGYEQAVTLWDGNFAAREGLQRTMLAHAEAAYANEDFDLGLSILDVGDETHQPLIEKLREGLHERESRRSRLTLLKRVAVAMLAFIVIGGSIMLYLINQQRQEANRQTLVAEAKTAEVEREKLEVVKQKGIAEEKRLLAEAETIRAENEKERANEQTEIAKQNLKEAKTQRKIADDKTIIANQKTEEATQSAKEARDAEALAKAKEQEAREQKEKAEYEVYLSQIGLAKAKVERNEFDDARRILSELKQIRGASKLGWEWRWLWQQANQSKAAERTNASIIDLSLCENGKMGVAVLEDGSLELFRLADDGSIVEQTNVVVKTQFPVVAAAIANNQQVIALGTSAGDLQIWDAQLKGPLRSLPGHEQRINHLHFTTDGRLVSGSDDRTARIWDTSSGKQLAVCWHIAAVTDVATAGGRADLVLATAVADRRSGRAVIWNVRQQGQPKRIGEFLQHDRPVKSIALSTDGSFAATGDVAGNVYLWRPSSVRKTKYESSISAAIQNIEKEPSGKPEPAKNNVAIGRLIDPNLPDKTTRLISTRGTNNKSRAHSDIVETIQFSKDGEHVLTGADDYTLKIWNVNTRQLFKTLRGHGGWVTGAEFVAGDAGKVLSISKDASIRAWNPKNQVQETVLIQSTRSRPAPAIPATAKRNGTGQSKPHDDEIWSARFDPDGERIVSASRDHTARILQIDRNTMTFREVTRLRQDETSVKENQLDENQLDEGTSFVAMSAVVDRKNGHLFVGSADSTIRIWDLVLGTEIGQVSGTGLNTSLALSKNGRLLLTGSSSPEAKALLWGIDPSGKASPELLYRLKGHEQAVTAFSISPDGRMLFTGDRSGIGWFWDTATGQQVGKAVEFSRGFRINAAQFSFDGTELFVASDDQQLTLIDVATQQRLERLSHDGPVTQLSLSGDGKRALTISELTTRNQSVAKAQIWNLKTGRSRVLDRVVSFVKKSNGDDEENTGGRPDRIRITSAQFGGQSRMAVVSRSAGEREPARVKVWDLAKPDAKPKIFDMPRRLGPAQAAIPLTNQNMLTLNGDAAFLWNLETMLHEKSYRSHAALTQVSFSFDGRFVATGSRSVKIWNSTTGAAVGKIESPHLGPVRSVQFSHTGPNYRLATTGDDGYVKVWQWTPSTSQFSQVAQYSLTADTKSQGDQLPGRCVSFSPDGQFLLAAGVGGVARIWSLKGNGAPTVYDSQDAGTFTCCDFSRDGKWIVLGSNDKKARLWKVAMPGKPVDAPTILEGHADKIEDVRILQDQSDEMRVLTASLDKSAKIWDPRLGSLENRGRELITLRKHTLGVTAIDATQNGELIMTASRDGTVILWPTGVQEQAAEKEENLFDSVLGD